MRSSLLTLIVLFFCQLSFAQLQINTLYTKDGKQTKNEKEAYYYRAFFYPFDETQKTTVEEYYMSTNDLKLKGTYKDKNVHQFIGPKFEYYENGNIKSKESYSDDGRRIDTAFYFYEGGQVKSVYFYPSKLDAERKLHIDSPLFLVHLDSLGKITLRNGTGYAELETTHTRERGNYLNHKRDGEWTGSFLDGKYTFTEHYQDGKLISGITKEPEGKEIPYDSTTFEIPPEYRGGINVFRKSVLDNYKYPDEAIKAYVAGTVIVSFVVEKDGKMRDFTIEKDLGYNTGNAAIEAVRKCGKWSPGIIRGIPVRVRYNMPIKLNIG